jgi:hypothetical protein
MSTAVYPSPTVQTFSEPQGESPRRGLAALAIQPLHLLSLFLCVAVFSGWLFTVTATLPLLAVVFFALLVLSAYYLGRFVLHVVPLQSQLACSFALIFLTGVLSWALLMLGLHSLLPGSLRWHTLLLFAASAAGQWLIHRREAPAREERSAALVSLFVVIFSLAAATCWARGLLHSTRPVADQVEFHHWMDYFDHAGFTSQFLGREHLWRFGNYEIGHLPTPVYHYGSYLYTAGLASFSRLSAYQVVIAFWTPFGTFLSGLAAYALVLSFGGRKAALCSVMALLALPDASYYCLKNAWFRYHWLQQLGSAGLYGVACAALALLFLLEARRSRSRMALLVAVAFWAATFFFKGQLFVVLTPFLIVWIVLCYPRCSVAWRILLLEGVVVLALAGILISNKYHLGPRLEPNQEYFEVYCRYAATESQPGFLRKLVENGTAPVGRSRFYLAATSLVVLSTLGVLVGFVPILCLWAWWKKKLHAVDLAPWLATAFYALFLVGLNDSVVGVNQGELIHRPFVWTYFVVMVWCAGKLGLLLTETRWGKVSLHPFVLCVLGLFLLILPWRMGRDIQEGKTIWRAVCCNLRCPRGLLECSRYVAQTGSRSDLVQDAQYDEHLVFGSLSERRSYLARPVLWKRAKNPLIPAEIDRRLALLEQFKTLTTAEQIQTVAVQTGIRWYLLHPNDRVAWPKEVLAAPAFRADDFAVYDLSKVGASRSVMSPE